MAQTTQSLGQKPKKEPKAWDIDENEFGYAPPRPKGDPWSVLLEPLLAEEKMRCDSLEKGVGNLLTFAGLFSAVVTALIIESYKTLQSDPNEAIIGLLSHIAHRLDNPINRTVSGSPTIVDSTSTPFSPTPPSIRINIFWFISLVLSLTAALLGIISLQWLSEYQSYPVLSPKEKLAVFNMRSMGMENWHVWKVFTALPLLLEAALVLFFIGLIDFLLDIDAKVAIPVAALIGLTLLFLLLTTALPTFQFLSLYAPFLFVHKLPKEPSQCPYKSPQSHALRVVIVLSCSALHFLFHHVHLFVTRLFARKAAKAKDKQLQGLDVLSHLSSTWRMGTWAKFDLAWLKIRNACGVHYWNEHFSNLAKDHQLLDQRFTFDINQRLRDIFWSNITKHDNDFISAIYHCFDDHSRSSVGQPSDDEETSYLNMVQHQIRAVLGDEDFSREDSYQFISFQDTNLFPFQKANMLHHHNLYMFLSKILHYRSSAMIMRHKVEIAIRIMKGLYGADYLLHPSADKQDPPPYLKISSYELPRHPEGVLLKEFAWQYSYVIMEFFKHASEIYPQRHVPGIRSLHTHHSIPKFLEEANERTASVIFRAPTAVEGDEINLVQAFYNIFKHISDCLKADMTPDVPPWKIYLLYTAALYVRPFISVHCMGLEDMRPDLANLFRTMYAYKERTIGVQANDPYLETQFEGKDTFDDTIDRFSTEWWSFLNDTVLEPSPTRSDLATTPELLQPALRSDATQVTYVQPNANNVNLLVSPFHPFTTRPMELWPNNPIPDPPRVPPAVSPSLTNFLPAGNEESSSQLQPIDLSVQPTILNPHFSSGYSDSGAHPMVNIEPDSSEPIGLPHRPHVPANPVVVDPHGPVLPNTYTGKDCKLDTQSSSIISSISPSTDIPGAGVLETGTVTARHSASISNKNADELV